MVKLQNYDNALFLLCEYYLSFCQPNKKKETKKKFTAK